MNTSNDMCNSDVNFKQKPKIFRMGVCTSIREAECTWKRSQGNPPVSLLFIFSIFHFFYVYHLHALEMLVELSPGFYEWYRIDHCGLSDLCFFSRGPITAKIRSPRKAAVGAADANKLSPSSVFAFLLLLCRAKVRLMLQGQGQTDTCIIDSPISGISHPPNCTLPALSSSLE